MVSGQIGEEPMKRLKMVPALSLLCGLCLVLGQRAGSVFQMEIGTPRVSEGMSSFVQ